MHGSASAAWAHLPHFRFTGGLNRQVEHHLFPTLPRHNLAKAQVLIRAFCSKHGMYYEVRASGFLSVPTCLTDLQPAAHTELLHVVCDNARAAPAGGGGSAGVIGSASNLFKSRHSFFNAQRSCAFALFWCGCTCFFLRAKYTVRVSALAPRVASQSKAQHLQDLRKGLFNLLLEGDVCDPPVTLTHVWHRRSQLLPHASAFDASYHRSKTQCLQAAWIGSQTCSQRG